MNIALTAKETVLIEPAYPIVLEDTGDTIQVGACLVVLSTYWLMVIRRFDKCLHLNLLQEEALGKLIEGFKSSDIGKGFGSGGSSGGGGSI